MSVDVVLLIMTLWGIGMWLHGYWTGKKVGGQRAFAEARRLFTKEGENYVPPSEKYVRKRTHKRD